MSERTFAVGDIHGCHIAFDVLLQSLQLTAGDRLIVLGDVVDRGPGSRQVVERLLELREVCQVDLILGNHEEVMLEAISRGGSLVHYWLKIGGAATVASYGQSPGDIPDEHIAFLESGLPYVETDDAIFIHANLEPGLPLDRQQSNWLRWRHLDGTERPHPSGRRIVCGHTSQKSGEPAVFDGWACIDTFAHGGGWLTCLNVASNQLIRTNQQGECDESQRLEVR